MVCVDYIIIIILVIIIAFLIWAEDRSQNGLNKPCQHSCPTFSSNDTMEDKIDKLIRTINLNHTVVEWRRSLLVAIICGLFIMIILRTINNECSLNGIFVVILVIFLILYMSSGYIYWSWFEPMDRKMIKVITRYN